MQTREQNPVLLAKTIALRHARKWTRPPHWGREDWEDEMTAVANYAMCVATENWDASYHVPLSTYVYQCVLRALWQLLRNEWRFARKVCMVDNITEHLTPRSERDSMEQCDVRQAIATLPTRERTIVEMLFYQQLTEREATSELGITAAHVHKLKERALLLLRKKLGGGGRMASKWVRACIIIIGVKSKGGFSAMFARHFRKAFASCVFTILVSLYMLMCLQGNAQRGWTARDANVDSRTLLVTSVLHDGQAGVYVLVRSPESRLIKYDEFGERIWQRAFGTYTAQTSVLSPDGDIFVGGHFSSQGVQGQDLFVAKYAGQDGSLRWFATYGGGDYYEDYFEDMAVDNNGNICLVGHSEKEREARAVVVKFRGTDGFRLWRFVAPANFENNANAVFVDDSNNIYVTGGSSGSSSLIWIWKLSPEGGIAWSLRYPEVSAVGVDIAVNNSGVYVLGRTSNGWIVLKYPRVNPGDEPEWSIQYTEGTPIPRKLLLDSSGRIYVVGYASGKSIVVAYTETSGGQAEEVWRRYVGDAYRYYGSARPHDIDAAVSNGRVYAAGVVFRRVGRRYEHGDFILSAYDAGSGQVLWQMRYGEDASGGSSPYNETASRLTIGGDGSLYVAGSSFTDSFEEEAVGTGEVITIKCAPLQLVASVDLDGYGGDFGSVWEEVQLRAERAEADRRVQVVIRSGEKALRHNADGSLPVFLLPDAADWEYDVAFKPYRVPCPPGDDISHWLRTAKEDVRVVSGSLNVAVTVVNGDIDGDDEITLWDFGQLVSAFGSMCGDQNWNPAADLDGDEEITLFDLGILVPNFGAVGEPSWWDE